jgi:hypothetical protein
MIDLYPAPEHQLRAPEPGPPQPPPWPTTLDGWITCIAHPLQAIGYFWVGLLAIKYGALIVAILLALAS